MAEWRLAEQARYHRNGGLHLKPSGERKLHEEIRFLRSFECSGKRVVSLPTTNLLPRGYLAFNTNSATFVNLFSE